MTFARLLLEMRQRAATLPDGSRSPAALERIAREILAGIPEGEQSDQVRCILVPFARSSELIGQPAGVSC